MVVESLNYLICLVTYIIYVSIVLEYITYD